MHALWNARSLRTKMTLLTSGMAALSAVIMVAASLWQMARFAATAHANVDQLLNADLEHIRREAARPAPAPAPERSRARAPARSGPGAGGGVAVRPHAGQVA